MTSTGKLKVLVFGASGRTGSVIVDELLKSQNFQVAIVTRPASLNKSEISAFRDRGVEVHAVPFPYPKDGSLEKAVKGVDIVVSALNYLALQYQKDIIDVVAASDVKRFIPCDFGTACIRGVRAMHDEKLDIHEYVISKGLNYTWIDVGWWFEITLPHIKENDPNNPVIELSRYYYGSGNVKTAVTDRRDIGQFVSRIIVDPRTINRYVFCWAEEVTQQEAFALAESVSGVTILRKLVNETDINELIETSSMRGWFEYQYSLWFRGDNTVENAKKAEYGTALDARELYPNLKLRTLEAWAHELYQK